MVVNPRIGRNIVEEAAELGISFIWLQPEHNEELTQLIEEKGIAYVKDCVLVALK